MSSLEGLVQIQSVSGRVNKYLITARRKMCGFHTVLFLSIPTDPCNSLPLENRFTAEDRTSVGCVKSNFLGTTYYACLDESIMASIHSTRLVDLNEVLIKYKRNFFSSWKPYEMKIYMKNPLSYTQNPTLPEINVLSTKPPEWDPVVCFCSLEMLLRVVENVLHGLSKPSHHPFC